MEKLGGNMKTKITLVLFAMFLVFNVSFSSTVRNRNRRKNIKSIKQQITDTSWKLVKISDDDFSKKGITLKITSKGLSGTAGVNNYFGTYKINGNKISVSKLGVTGMLGSNKKMEAEETYIDILENVKTIEIKGNKLILKTELEEILTFVKDLDDEVIPYSK